MTKNVWKKAATVVLGASLVGGVVVEIPSALTTTQAQASTQIPYAQYQSDIRGVESAVDKATVDVQSDVTSELPDPNDEDAYAQSGSFDNYLNSLEFAVSGDTDNKEQAIENLSALVATYNVFKSRLTAGEQNQLESMASKINNEIVAADSDVDYRYDISQNLSAYVDALDSAVLNYGNNYDGVASEPKAVSQQVPAQKAPTPKTSTKKSYISKLSVKKSSKKYVKVTGSAKLYKSAKYARVHTYKGNKYTKLSSKHNFSKKVYAPKAKTVKVTVGNYSHGHFSSVTSTKTAHLK
ncbi:hypothetical protein IWT140_01910 [Secundilactobacillus pentosiphilus]|uniref:Uncharacterized protein n=1 Tax=Secundilactobacillus pentosiphilus TaxID=1714682 RepID=A0A1Z5IRQ0_9LACO|nr:hypothetical protein [Secundilactobacillus pentosiphilus]GAX04272.1 hypothetical protein IWT140_01910 [Secundilactobacillus pentosiphilus]